MTNFYQVDLLILLLGCLFLWLCFLKVLNWILCPGLTQLNEQTLTCLPPTPLIKHLFWRFFFKEYDVTLTPLRLQHLFWRFLKRIWGDSHSFEDNMAWLLDFWIFQPQPLRVWGASYSFEVIKPENYYWRLFHRKMTFLPFLQAF